jgi:hypothetical protein
MSDDAKGLYHTTAMDHWEKAQKDAELQRKMEHGAQRAKTYGANWQKVNLNDVVDTFAPGIDPDIKGTKMIWSNPALKIDVVCDIGGGYLRLQDMSIPPNQPPKYLDLNGQHVDYVVKPNGRLRGVTKSERNAQTHFWIKKREEM